MLARVNTAGRLRKSETKGTLWLIVELCLTIVLGAAPRSLACVPLSIGRGRGGCSHSSLSTDSAVPSRSKLQITWDGAPQIEAADQGGLDAMQLWIRESPWREARRRFRCAFVITPVMPKHVPPAGGPLSVSPGECVRAFSRVGTAVTVLLLRRGCRTAYGVNISGRIEPLHCEMLQKTDLASMNQIAARLLEDNYRGSNVPHILLWFTG
jgi:hypothetical protein